MIDLLLPVKAVILSGQLYGRRADRLITTCPGCEAELTILGPSMVCATPGCSFSRGSSIDFLAKTSGSYERAIELAVDSVPYYRDRVEVEAGLHRKKRRLLEFALGAERDNQMMDSERVMLKSQFSRYLGIPSKAFQRGHWFLTTAQSNTLIDILCELELDIPPNLHSRPTAIAPYWGEHHSLAHLYVLSGTFDSFKMCKIEEFRNSWFGLPQAHPTANTALVMPSYGKAMQREELTYVFQPDVFPTSLHVEINSGKPGLEFERLIFWSEEDKLAEHLARWSYAEGFERASFVTPEIHEGLTLRHLLEHLLRKYESNFYKFIDMCSGLKIGPEIRAHLLAISHQMSDQRQATILRNTLSRRLMDVDEKGAIYECADGYSVVTANQPKQATNFTMEFKSVTSFSALSDLLYSGRFYVGPTSYPFEIPSRRLENPTQLAEILQNIQTLSGCPPDMPTATVYRPREFRRVLEIFRVQNADLTRLRGVQALGWGRKHDLFILPTAVVDPQGVQTGVRYHPDEEGEHHCYSSVGSGPETVPELMPEFDPYLAEFLSAMVSQMVRYHHGLKVRLWPLLNNAETREKAGRIFAGIGQTAPLRLTKIIPRNLELNRGLPCLLAPLANELQMNKLQMAGAVLSGRGLDLGRMSDDQIDRAAIILPALLVEVARRILAGESVSFRERRSVQPLGTLADEGARLLQSDFWPTWPAAGIRWASIDRVFEAGETRLTELLAEKEDAVLLRPPLWEGPGIEAVDLQIELGLCCRKISMGADGLSVDRPSMYLLLGEFFGEVPVLQPA